LSPLLDFEGNLLPEFLWSVPDCVEAKGSDALLPGFLKEKVPPGR
jgi:hypothetical protein